MDGSQRETCVRIALRSWIIWHGYLVDVMIKDAGGIFGVLTLVGSALVEFVMMGKRLIMSVFRRRDISVESS